MSTSATVSIATPEPPALALQRLEAFGREWRESKLPEALRARGYHTSTVSRRGNGFVITLGPTGRGPAYVLEGRCVASGSGSLLSGEVREAYWSRAIVSAVLVLATMGLVGIFVREAGRIGDDWALPIVIGIAIGGRALIVRASKRTMTPLFAELVEHALRPEEAVA